MPSHSAYCCTLGESFLARHLCHLNTYGQVVCLGRNWPATSLKIENMDVGGEIAYGESEYLFDLPSFMYFLLSSSYYDIGPPSSYVLNCLGAYIVYYLYYLSARQSRSVIRNCLDPRKVQMFHRPLKLERVLRAHCLSGPDLVYDAVCPLCGSDYITGQMVRNGTKSILLYGRQWFGPSMHHASAMSLKCLK